MADEAAVQSQEDMFDDIDLSGLSDEEKKYVQMTAESEGHKAKDEDAKQVQSMAESIKEQDEKTGVTGISNAHMSMAFYDALPRDKQEKLDQLAPQQLSQFLKEPGLISEFGKSAVEKVNAVVDSMIQENSNIKVPEIDELLTNANRDLDNYVAKYREDISLDKQEGKFLSWFKNKKRKAVDWNFERKEIMQKLDILQGKLIVKREVMKKSFYQIRQLLAENRKSTNGMVGFLAALEAIHAEAIRRAVIIEKRLDSIDKEAPEYQEVADELANVAEVANAIEQQHANYMARLAVAWTANSQIRNLQRVQNTVVRNIAQVINHTIPMMKMSIAQIQVISVTKDAAHATDVLKEANEAAAKMLTSLQVNDLPDIEAKAQAPIVSADTINALADGVEAANKRLVEAINAGREERTKMEAAVLAAGEKIKSSDELRDKKLVEALLGERQEEERMIAEFDKVAGSAYTGAGDTMDDAINNL